VAIRLDEIVKQRLMFPLFNHQDERVRAHALTDIGEIDLAAYFTADDHPRAFGLPTQVDKFVGKSDLFVDLERAGLNSDRFRMRSSRLVLVDDDETDARRMN
jgi:hypothetical protein